jgi:hypothetical protein
MAARPKPGTYVRNGMESDHQNAMSRQFPESRAVTVTRTVITEWDFMLAFAS